MDDLRFKIGLSLIPSIGPLLVRRIVSYTGSVEAVFKEKKQALEKIPGIGSIKASSIKPENILAEADKELEYIQRGGIKALFYLDDNYPIRLRECEDGPIILYSKGKVDFNSTKVISIVGTRNATEYGKAATDEIVGYLSGNYPDLIVVSGLAYGIDIAAHKAALQNKLNTIAALAHGFEFLYPSHHASVAKTIVGNGALITEFQSSRKPDPGNFVSRNRIIAGLADATIVIESAEKGGALITADLANSYNRDVFAVPGRANDTYSRGCNLLIKQNKAALIECGADIEAALSWFTDNNKPKTIQKSLFTELSPEEQSIMVFLEENGESPLDHISISLNLPIARVSANLLNMEFSGLIKTLPGKNYRKI